MGAFHTDFPRFTDVTLEATEQGETTSLVVRLSPDEDALVLEVFSDGTVQLWTANYWRCITTSSAKSNPCRAACAGPIMPLMSPSERER